LDAKSGDFAVRQVIKLDEFCHIDGKVKLVYPWLSGKELIFMKQFTP
jgi:hypothetical protein